MSRSRRVILVSSLILFGCLGCRTSIHPGGDPPQPALLALAPADASLVMWLPDLTAAVQGAADYANRLVADTGWAITAEKHASWKQSFGFSPLDPNSYTEGGIDVSAGALVVIQQAQEKPMLALKLSDPNRFDAFMRRSQTLEGVPPQRTELTVSGHRVISWAPQAEDALPTHCLFWEDFVIAHSDLKNLTHYIERLPQMPSLVHDSAAMAAQSRVPAGILSIWSHPAGDPPQGPMHWTLSTTRLGSTGMSSETFEPNIGEPHAASPNALALSTLLERIDPLSFLVVAMGASSGGQPWRSVDKLLQHDAGHFGAVEEAFGEATGLNLSREVLPQLGEVMTLGVRWLNLAPPEGGWGGLNLPSLVLQLEAGATLEVKDGAAVSKLLERSHDYLQGQGSHVQVSSQKVGNETVQVYAMHAGGESAFGVDVPVRCAVWHNLLVLGVGNKGLTRVFDYLTGKPANWKPSLSEAFVTKHVQQHTSMALLRFGVIGQALADFVRDTPSAPALGLLVGDLATIMLRLDDVSTSGRVVEGGSLGSIEQRFAVDTSERL